MDHEVVLGGVRLRYRERGRRDAPVIVALHAAGQDRHSWDEVAGRLADRWRVLALDQRGHGGSDWPGEYSFELLCDDVVGLVTALGLDQVVLVGHSMGGTVATLVAERHPGLVRRLVLEDTPPPRRTPRPLRFPDTPPVHLRLDPRAWTALMGQLAGPDPAWWSELIRITAPTLIIGGGATSFVPQSELALAADRIPECRLVTLEGAGHQVHANRPEEFAEQVRDFLGAEISEG